jgi:hypothetical protein
MLYTHSELHDWFEQLSLDYNSLLVSVISYPYHQVVESVDLDYML